MRLQSSSRGVALIIVLGFLVIISGLAIAFFTSVTTELSASRSYASGVTTRQLSESAVNVVMGQIREATARQNGAWASQPGMIRVYRDGSAASPNADAFFKLYSARNMVVTKSQIAAFDPGATPSAFASDPDGNKGDVSSDWDSYPGIFTDLNSPVLVPNPAGGDPKPVFPIVDPGAKELVNGEPLVEGFDYSAEVNGAVAGGDSNMWRIPMPVRWMYVLQDGTLTAPKEQYSTPGGGTGAQWTASSDFRTPTKDNPIVGRIAFWTDDDSSKININTAGGYGKQAATPSGYDDGYTLNKYAGSFWDTPRVYTSFDIGQTNPADGTLKTGIGAGGLASTQPAQKEFQRYPGHPATTSLGAVFARLLSSEQIYQLVPRFNGGGNSSQGGTKRLERATALELDLKSERLYASLDELLYSQASVGNGERQTNDQKMGVTGVTTPEMLEKVKFFLTPHSRAPELNLFGRPRVAIWPVAQASDESANRNGFDRAIAYCATVGGKKFIFTRIVTPAGKGSGAQNLTADITSTTYSRNAELMKYLRDLTSKAIPGYGGNFQTKYGVANRDAILGQIFDYIRIANLMDTTTGMTNSKYAPRGLVAPTRSDVFGTGQKIGGFGRWATISEASLVFYCAGIEAGGLKKPDDTVIAPGLYRGEVHKDDRAKIALRHIKAFLVFSTFNPMQGYAPVATPAEEEKETFEVTGLNGFTVDGQPLGFPATGTNKLNASSGGTWGGRNFGGYEGLMHTLAGHNTDYAFEAKTPAKIAFNKTVFSFNGGEVEVKIKFGPHLLQTIKLKFDGGTWNVPERWYRTDNGGFVQAKIPQDGSNSGGALEMAQSLLDENGVKGRISWSMQHSANPDVTSGKRASNRWRQLIQPGDIVRSLVYGTNTAPPSATKDGDLRILALSEKVDVKDFQPHPDYKDPKYRFAQGLRAADGNTYIFNMPYWKVDGPEGARDATLAETTAYGNHVFDGTLRVAASKAMMLPYSQGTPTGSPPNGGVNGVARSDGRAGDFDTGLGVFADGPYAGKQDEGNVIFKYFDNFQQKWIYPIPYAGTHEYEQPGDIFFSPNRQMPSPGLLGSLLARPMDTAPRRQWETLAFCPNTVGPRHPGNTLSPKDHLLLDLFYMPFVEPYLISEPLSTAGRVNLNYQIAPFGYIKRSTALRAALHPLRVSAIPKRLMATYKGGTLLTSDADNARLALDRDETVKALDEFFAQYRADQNKGFFKSASEICERFLYPVGTKFVKPLYDPVSATTGESNILTFWNNMTLTGDNMREKPYSDLYPRVTTKSNTYTVHMRVQTLRQIGQNGDFTKWREGIDPVLGEFRGATTIERYIDPSDVRLVQKMAETDPNKQSLEDIYRCRVIATKKFAP